MLPSFTITPIEQHTDPEEQQPKQDKYQTGSKHAVIPYRTAHQTVQGANRENHHQHPQGFGQAVDREKGTAEKGHRHDDEVVDKCCIIRLPDKQTDNDPQRGKAKGTENSPGQQRKMQAHRAEHQPGHDKDQPAKKDLAAYLRQ